MNCWNMEPFQNLFPIIKGPLKEAWGLSSMLQTCCGAIFGTYFNEENGWYDCNFLGNTNDQAKSPVHLVKSFL